MSLARLSLLAFASERYSNFFIWSISEPIKITDNMPARAIILAMASLFNGSATGIF